MPSTTAPTLQALRVWVSVWDALFVATLWCGRRLALDGATMVGDAATGDIFPSLSVELLRNLSMSTDAAAAIADKML